MYTAEAAASGRVHTMEGPEVGLIRAGSSIANSLHIPDETEVIVRHENGYVDGLPWLRQTSYYPGVLGARAPRLLETGNIEEGVVACLARLGIGQSGYQDSIAWRTPSELETSYFGLPADGHIQVVESAVLPSISTEPGSALPLPSAVRTGTSSSSMSARFRRARGAKCNYRLPGRLPFISSRAC